MSDPVPPLPASPIAIAGPAPAPAPNPVGGINILRDKYEYKTIQATIITTLDTRVNEHINDGWKLYGDMKTIDSGYISSGYHNFIFFQSVIRKLPGQGGGRSSVRTRKTKLKSHPPHKRNKNSSP